MTYACNRCRLEFTDADDRNHHQFACKALPTPEPKRKNPGSSLEKLVRDSAALFDDRGLSLDQVSPRTVGRQNQTGGFAGRVVGKGLLDFVGDLLGRAVYFDTKHCEGTALPLNRLEPHQIERVKRGHARGAIAFFLVAFTKPSNAPRYFALTWPVLAPYLEDASRKSIPYSAFLANCPEVKRSGRVLDVLGAVKAAGEAA